MLDLRKSLVCTGWNLTALVKTPRCYLGLALGFLLCLMMTSKTLTLSASYHTNIQIVEPFIWCFSDADSILYASLILLLLLADFPNLDHAASYLIFRTNRKSWMAGQVFTVLVITFAYTLFLLAVSVLLSLGNTIFSNTWSQTALMLSYARPQFDPAIEVTRKAVKLTLPYSSLIHVFFLLYFYVLLLSCVQLSATLYRNRKAGTALVLLISLMGFVLTPDRFMGWFALPTDLQYVANLMSAWASPLQHATYVMHNLGYDLLPTLGTSYLLMGGASLALIILGTRKMKTYQFVFSGAED